MSKTNFKHVAQFTRGVHQPLKSAARPAIDRFVPDINYEGHPWNLYQDYLHERVIENLIQKYRRPPLGTPRFWEKATIPRGMSDKLPFGDPKIIYRGLPTFGGMIVRPLEKEFLEKWIESIASTA